MTLRFLCMVAWLTLPGSVSLCWAAGEGERTAVTPWSDVRGQDLRGSALDLALIRTLWFNGTTLWDADDQVLAQQVLEEGKNPGLGVRGVHAGGVTGAGVAVAIIDQNLCLDHPEFAGKIIKYRDFGTGMPPNQGSMHAPAVTSLLVGNTLGTAPGARVYFAAAPSWTGDAQYIADALDWVVAENTLLPAGQKIRVVSISAAPSGPGSPFTQHNDAYEQAYLRAVNAGLLVLDCTTHHGLINAAYYQVDDPDDPNQAIPGFPETGGTYEYCSGGSICAPNSFRTQAEEYQQPQWSYQYMGQGGLSWSIPYVAGVLALGWEVNPALSNSQIWQLLVDSAAPVRNCRVVDPAAFIRRVLEETPVWVSHVTAAGGWKTTLSVYNPGSAPALFQVIRYDADGAPAGTTPLLSAPAKAWVQVPPEGLGSEGTAMLLSAAELSVKLEYQYGDSPSVCEFFANRNLGRAWMIPNPGRAWFSYAGLALTNPQNTVATVRLQAWKGGALVAERELTVAPNARLALLSGQIWPGVELADFDTAVMLCSADIPAPISITGNAAQDRHLFFPAQRVSAEGVPTSVR